MALAFSKVEDDDDDFNYEEVDLGDFDFNEVCTLTLSLYHYCKVCNKDIKRGVQLLHCLFSVKGGPPWPSCYDAWLQGLSKTAISKFLPVQI